MAITATERTQVIELTVLMFNAAPGATYLEQILAVYEQTGENLQTLARILADTPAYKGVNPDTQTTAEFVTAFLTPLGLQDDAVAVDFVTAMRAGGASKGEIAYAAYVALNEVAINGAPQYVKANAILNNKTMVAEIYSVTLATAETDLTALQGVVASVTETAASVAAAVDAVTPDPVVPGANIALTTGADFPALTASADVVTGTDLTFNASDVIADSTTGDNDTLTVNVSAGVGNISAATATVVGVENLNFNFNSFAAPDINAVNIKNGVITVNQSQVGGAATATVSNAGNVSVVAGTGVTGTLAVTQGSGVSTTVVSQGAATVVAANNALTTANTINVTAGKDKAITVGGTAATTDAATISGSGSSSLTTNSGAAVETLTLQGNGAAATFILQNALTGATLTAAGDQNLTVSATSSQVTGRTLTDATAGNTTTLKVTATVNENDLSKVGFDAIEVTTVTAGGDDLIFASTGDVVTVSATANRLDLVAGTKGSTATTDEITIIGTGATTVIGNATGGAGATADGFETVHYSSGATAGNTLTATLGADATLHITGSKNVTIGAGSTAKQVNAADLTGVLTVTTAAGLTKVTSGSGADVIGVGVSSTIVAGAGDDAITSTVGGAFGTIDAGAGDDTVTLAAGDTGTVTGGEGTDTLNLNGASAAKFSGFEVVNVTGATGVAASSLSGQALILKGNTLAFAASDLSTVDLSTLTVDPAMTSVTFAMGLDATKFGSATGFTYTGTSVVDNVTGTANADVINGGGGADVLSAGAGADVVNGGAGNDTITGGTGADFLTGGTGADTFVFAAGDSGTISSTVYDTITDYTAGVGGDNLDLEGAAAAAADAAAADVSAASNNAGKAINAAITNGVITVSGSDATLVDTLTEWLAIARAVNAVDTEVVAFQFGSNTYVYQENAGGDLLIELTGVTGITALGAVAAANTVVIG